MSDDKINFQIDRKALVTMLCGGTLPTRNADQADVDASDAASSPFTVDLPITIKRRSFENRIVIDNHVQPRLPDPNLIDLIAGPISISLG